MTKETFAKAKNLMDDIKSLKTIKSEFENDHWVSLYGAEEGEQSISNGILRKDLEKFVDEEIDKLEKELEKL